MDLNTIEMEWKQKELGELKTFELTIKKSLKKFDSNIWIHIRALKYLERVMTLADIVKLTAAGNWERNEAGERCMIEKIEGIIRRNEKENEKIIQWQILGKNKRFRYYALAKEAAMEYRIGNNIKALQLMLLAESEGSLDNNQKKIKLLIIANQKTIIRKEMIDQLIKEHGNTKSIEMYSLLITIAIISSKKKHVERFYIVVQKMLAQNWEYLMWYNRIPLKLNLEKKFIEQIEDNYHIAVKKKDYRWLYQYALAIIRHGNYLKGYSILKVVNQKHASLSHLCEPLVRCIEEYNKEKQTEVIEVSCRTQRLRLYRAEEQLAICVIFSGWYSSLGNIPEYIVKKKLLEIGMTTIIVKDESLNWFMKKGKKIDQKLKGTIRENIQETKSNGCKVVFIGSSITGLTALEYATECETTSVLLYASPYQETNRVRGNEKREGKKIELKKKIVEEVFNDTKSRMETLARKNVEVVYEYGKGNEEDKRNAVKFCRFENCSAKGYSGIATHSISGYCVSMGYMQSTLNKMCRSREWQ